MDLCHKSSNPLHIELKQVIFDSSLHHFESKTALSNQICVGGGVCACVCVCQQLVFEFNATSSTGEETLDIIIILIR